MKEPDVIAYEIPPQLPPGNGWRIRGILTNLFSFSINGWLGFDRVRDGSNWLAVIHLFCAVAGAWIAVEFIAKYTRDVRKYRAWRRQYMQMTAENIGRELARRSRDADE